MGKYNIIIVSIYSIDETQSIPYLVEIFVKLNKHNVASFCKISEIFRQIKIEQICVHMQLLNRLQFIP